MVKKIIVKNPEEFEEMLQQKDIKISKAIVETVLANLSSKKRFIPLLEIHVQDEGNIFDITLDRRDVITTLKQNLHIHELHEDYEGCARISSAIKSFESNQK